MMKSKPSELRKKIQKRNFIGEKRESRCNNFVIEEYLWSIYSAFL
ncbi:unnamed protein product, partial [Larinioides sclopetarius]